MLYPTAHTATLRWLKIVLIFEKFDSLMDLSLQTSQQIVIISLTILEFYSTITTWSCHGNLICHKNIKTLAIG